MASGKCKLKQQSGYHYIPIKMTKIWNTDSKCWQGLRVVWMASAIGNEKEMKKLTVSFKMRKIGEGIAKADKVPSSWG